MEPINNLLDTVDFDAVFYSLDWHPSDHVSFIDNVKMRPLDESSPVSKFNKTFKISLNNNKTSLFLRLMPIQLKYLTL